jgi:hypothetical protein
MSREKAEAMAPELCNVPLATNKGGSRTSVASTHSTQWEAEESCPVRPQPQEECLVFTSITMEPQQASDATQLYMDNINQIRNHFPKFFGILSYHIGKQASQL